VTIEEAMAIYERRLPEEPREDWVAAWRASRPLPEPTKRAQRLDTTPAQAIDWSLIIRQALLGERSFLVEAFGGALGEVRNALLDEIETVIAQAISELRTEFAEQINQLRTALLAELANRIDQLADEFSGQVDLIHSQGDQLRSQLEHIIAKKARTKRNLLQLPAPNGDAHGPQ
jgi:hypothetical protein